MQAGRAGALEQARQRVALGLEQIEKPRHSVTLAAGRADAGEALRLTRGVGAPAPSAPLRLDDHHREVVGDHVAELAAIRARPRWTASRANVVRPAFEVALAGGERRDQPAAIAQRGAGEQGARR